MARLQSILFGTALLAVAPLFAQLAHAQQEPVQGGSDITLHPPQAVQPERIEPATSGGMAVGTIVQTAPPTQVPSAASMSSDPFVQRREARAQARAEYRARMQAARQQYQADLHAADAILYQQSGN